MVYISYCKTKMVLAEILNSALQNSRWFSTQMYQVNFNHNKNQSFELDGSNLCPQFFFLPYRKAVELLSSRCPGSWLFLWGPRGRDPCDNMACEPALYGHDKDSSDTSVHKTDRGSGDKSAALRLIHLFGDGTEVFGDSQLILIRLPMSHVLPGYARP